MSDNTLSCLNCRLAKWQRTKSENLHPFGDGRCQWQMPEIAMPKSRYWLGFEQSMPKVSESSISRKRPHTGCPCWEAKNVGTHG